ncbi:hypothetical protein FJU08_01260 [Martelella alba]|uniref:Uncharacterized protein n=1 Tax=Martelella alba TaxID=2590451 RepID=A0A506UIU6_9HYPH|nr:hypothetical protein [Martelella alba]TPW33222.1 hypothetical protein FJU08_01260 [Martelella alba]
MKKATPNQLSALKWLKNRSGDGVFDRNQVLNACGERAPVMRSTWNKLRDLGLVEPYLNNRRLRITENGLRIDLSKVNESENGKSE